MFFVVEKMLEYFPMKIYKKDFHIDDKSLILEPARYLNDFMSGPLRKV